MAVVRQNEILAKAVGTDPSPIPRYNLVDAGGNVVAANIALELQNAIVQQGTPVDKQALDECLAASGTAGGTKRDLTLVQPGYTLFDGAVVEFKLFDAMAGAATLNVNSTGAKRIKMPNGEDPDGFIAGDWITAIYSATLDTYVISGGGSGGGSIDMNINLLEEVEKMKYCEVLTMTNEQTEESVFLSDSQWALGCKHPTQGWTCMVKNTPDAAAVMQFRSKLANGTIHDFALDIGSSFFYKNNNVTSQHFAGAEVLVPVQNRPNEVCLIVCGYTYVSYGTSDTYPMTWRIWAIFDVTTGMKKASSVSYSIRNSYGSYLYCASKASFWCYYNSTYDYYYAPFCTAMNSSTSYGNLCGMQAGHNFLDYSSDTSITLFSDFRMGTTNTDSYYAGWGYFIDNSNFIFAQIQPSKTVYVYKGTLTSATAISRTTLASSTSIPTFQTSVWAYASVGSLHALLTNSNQLYLYASGRASTVSTSEYYVANRYGPFTINTTAITEAANYQRMFGFPENNYSYTYFRPAGNVNKDPNKLVYTNANNVSAQQTHFYQTWGDSNVYRLLLPVYASSTVDGVAINPLLGLMCPAMCCDNTFSWAFTATMYKMGSFAAPNDRRVAATQFWTCPEDGIYKVILVGGGAAGSATSGGGSGYLRIFARRYVQGQQVPYIIGGGEEYVGGTTYTWMYKYSDRSTHFDDELALPGVSNRGGASGWPAASGGGGGGYNLVAYGGNGQDSSHVPNFNGGQGSMPATGYGAGGSAGQKGQDGCIVIIR